MSFSQALLMADVTNLLTIFVCLIEFGSMLLLDMTALIIPHSTGTNFHREPIGDGARPLEIFALLYKSKMLYDHYDKKIDLVVK